MSTSTYSREAMLARYRELCAQRDAVNAGIAGVQATLDAANAEAQAAQARAQAAKAAIESARGGAKWFDLKREIATLANALGRIPAA